MNLQRAFTLKKIIMTALMIALMVGLSACSSNSNISNSEQSSSNISIETAKSERIEEKTEAETKAEVKDETKAEPEDEIQAETWAQSSPLTEGPYIGNKKNGKLHKNTCSNPPKEENRVYFNSVEEAIAAGYDSPCGNCNPFSNQQTENTSETVVSVNKGEEYCSHEEVAKYIHLYKELPPNYITREEAEKKGWKSNNPQLVLGRNACIGGSEFKNKEKLLPEENKYFECDVDYCDDGRGPCRLIYTEDGKVYYTNDHYESFEELY